MARIPLSEPELVVLLRRELRDRMYPGEVILEGRFDIPGMAYSYEYNIHLKRKAT